MYSSTSTIDDKIKLKIVFLGDQSVGKSSIIERYIQNRFEEVHNPTIGIDFLAKNIKHKANNYRLQLWDTAGQQRYRSLIPSYLKDADFALIVYDITSRTSFESTQSWINLFNQNKNKKGFIYLVGNKTDMNYREVTMTEAMYKAQMKGISSFQISAKTGKNVQELFVKMIQQTNNKIPNQQITKNLQNQINTKTNEIAQQGSQKAQSWQKAQKITTKNMQKDAQINLRIAKNHLIQNSTQGKKTVCC